MQYFDKNGKEIKAGMKILMEDGKVELVYDTEDAYGNPNLGINASNEDFLRAHPNWAREFYSLSMFNMAAIEICPSEPEIKAELEKLAPIIDGTEHAIDYGEKVSREDYGGMFDGKEDHVWMDKKGFEKFKVGDSVEFFAEVYRYVKTGNGKQIDFGLRNPEGIKQIPSYQLPTDEELAEQSIMMIICETCHLSEHCNRTVCMRPKKEINQLKKSMKDLIMK